MSRTFDSLNGMDGQSQSASQGDSNVPVTANYAAILADELAQIERIVGHSIGKLKAVVEVGADAAKNERVAREKFIATLQAEVARANEKIAGLEDRALIAESMLRVKEGAIVQMQQATAARIADLENQLRGKEARSAADQSRIGALESEVARLKDGVVEMAAFMANHAKRLTEGVAPQGKIETPVESFAKAPEQAIFAAMPETYAATLLDR